jgi:hypothetical protein
MKITHIAVNKILEMLRQEYAHDKDIYPTIGIQTTDCGDPEEIQLTDKSKWEFVEDWLIIREVTEIESNGKDIEVSCIFSFQIKHIISIREI